MHRDLDKYEFRSIANSLIGVLSLMNISTMDCCKDDHDCNRCGSGCTGAELGRKGMVYRRCYDCGATSAADDQTGYYRPESGSVDYVEGEKNETGF